MEDGDQEIFSKIDALKDNLNKVICGKEEALESLLIAFFAGGNVLIEDVPGVGKTTLAKALARSINGVFKRVQFTPDLLPSDILGSSIYNPKEGSFHFRSGPIFSNIFLADEINRASPRTQSALLEAMTEHQVTIEGTTYPLTEPFIVIATQNPIEYYGTYPLPEAQLDRFSMQLSMGYPDEEFEIKMLFDRQKVDPLKEIEPVISIEEVVEIQKRIQAVTLEESVTRYISAIIRATRKSTSIQLGASPRAMLILGRCAQAFAFLNKRDYVLPDDVQTLAQKVLAHRIVLENKVKHSGMSKESVITSILKGITVPV